MTRPARAQTIAVVGLAGLLGSVLLLRSIGFLVPHWVLSILLSGLCVVAGAFWGLRVLMAFRSGEVNWVAGWNWDVKTFPKRTAPIRYWAAVTYFAALSVISTGAGVLIAFIGKISN